MSSRFVRKKRSKVNLNFQFHTVIVHRSNKNISAQVLQPKTKKCLCTFNSNNENGVKTDQAKKVGKKVADFLKKQKVNKVVFDRNGYVYHGRIMALAEAIRKEDVNI